MSTVKKVLSMRKLAESEEDVQVELFVITGTKLALCISDRDRHDRKKHNGIWIQKTMLRILNKESGVPGQWTRILCVVNWFWWKANLSKLEALK